MMSSIQNDSNYSPSYTVSHPKRLEYLKLAIYYTLLYRVLDVPWTYLYIPVLKSFKCVDWFSRKGILLPIRDCILYIYSMYIITEFMRHAAQATYFPPQSATYFICYLFWFIKYSHFT